MTLKVTRRRTVAGIEMGVLSDGTSFVAIPSLLRMCGISMPVLRAIVDRWAEGDRDSTIVAWLAQQGFESPGVSLLIAENGGTEVIGEKAVALLLEFFAFESSATTVEALANFRLLARCGLRAFVYRSVGLIREDPIDLAWREFHNRMEIHLVPRGFFSVFKEVSSLVVASIRAGAPMDHRTMPDVSVGTAWSKHWLSEKLVEKYGDRRSFEHHFPLGFPQAESNPQQIWIYPIDALGAFRSWLDTVYLQEAFPKYLQTKVDQGLIPPDVVDLLLHEVTDPPKLQ